MSEVNCAEMKLGQREFDLPPDDIAFLDGLGLLWETVVQNGKQWVFIHEFPLHEGYNRSTVSVAVWIRPGYPTSPLDMAFFYPHIACRDGRSIPCSDHQETIDGVAWQRWSRHRTNECRWQPGIDSLKTHVSLIQAWLAREVTR